MDIKVQTDFLDRMMARGLTAWESRILAALMAQGIIDGSMSDIVVDTRAIIERIRLQLERAGEPVPAGMNVQLSNGLAKLTDKGFLTPGGKRGHHLIVTVANVTN